MIGWQPALFARGSVGGADRAGPDRTIAPVAASQAGDQRPASPLALRPYQEEAIAAALDATGPALLCMATGSGKSATAAAFVARYITGGSGSGPGLHGEPCACDGTGTCSWCGREVRVLWLAHRKELIDQAATALRRAGCTVGIVRADLDEHTAPVVVASVQTLAVPGRLDRLGPRALVLVDEAHHASSPTYRAVLERYAGARVVGLTATPDRDDGTSLDGWEIAYDYPIATAIRSGYLVRPWSAVARLPDLHLPSVTGRWDYDDAELGAELLRAGVVAHTVEVLCRPHECRQMPREDGDERRTLDPRGRSWLVYTATVEQARLTSEALAAAGWRSGWVSGETAREERRGALEAYTAGALEVLCSAGVLTEGTDLPRTSGILLARPTRSRTLYLQIVGRGLRLAPGKVDCMVLDLAGATEVHSLITAPLILPGGRPCPLSADGAHAWARAKSGARCECGARVACWPDSAPAPVGAHVWTTEHLCRACERPRCPESPSRDHLWAWLDARQRECVHCGCRVADPLSALHPDSRPQRQEGAREAVWCRVPGVTPQLVVCDVVGHGEVYAVADGDAWRLSWLPKQARVPRALSREAIPREYVRAYADSICAMADRLDLGSRRGWPSRAQVERGERYGVCAVRGESQHDHAVRVLVARARERAISAGLVARA